MILTNFMVFQDQYIRELDRDKLNENSDCKNLHTTYLSIFYIFHLLGFLDRIKYKYDFF